jgi:hypothetical protein
MSFRRENLLIVSATTIGTLVYAMLKPTAHQVPQAEEPEAGTAPSSSEGSMPGGELKSYMVSANPRETSSNSQFSLELSENHASKEWEASHASNLFPSNNIRHSTASSDASLPAPPVVTPPTRDGPDPEFAAPHHPSSPRSLSGSFEKLPYNRSFDKLPPHNPHLSGSFDKLPSASDPIIYPSVQRISDSWQRRPAPRRTSRLSQFVETAPDPDEHSSSPEVPAVPELPESPESGESPTKDEKKRWRLSRHSQQPQTQFNVKRVSKVEHTPELPVDSLPSVPSPTLTSTSKSRWSKRVSNGPSQRVSNGGASRRGRTSHYIAPIADESEMFSSENVMGPD